MVEYPFGLQDVSAFRDDFHAGLELLGTNLDELTITNAERNIFSGERQLAGSNEDQRLLIVMDHSGDRNGKGLSRLAQHNAACSKCVRLQPAYFSP